MILFTWLCLAVAIGASVTLVVVLGRLSDDWADRQDARDEWERQQDAYRRVGRCTHLRDIDAEEVVARWSHPAGRSEQ